MFKGKVNGIDVIVNLEPGVYVFDKNSATGKTRLYYLLQDLQKSGSSILTFSFGDLSLGFTVENAIKIASTANIMILDRMDKYLEIGKQIASHATEDCIILIDCKGDLPLGIFNWDICFIDMTPGCIEVAL